MENIRQHLLAKLVRALRRISELFETSFAAGYSLVQFFLQIGRHIFITVHSGINPVIFLFERNISPLSFIRSTNLFQNGCLPAFCCLSFLFGNQHSVISSNQHLQIVKDGQAAIWDARTSSVDTLKWLCERHTYADRGIFSKENAGNGTENYYSCCLISRSRKTAGELSVTTCSRRRSSRLKRSLA